MYKINGDEVQMVPETVKPWQLDAECSSWGKRLVIPLSLFGVCTASLDGSLQKQMQNLFSLFTFFFKSENPLCICVVVANESRY